jgi:hypothetical protein
MLKTAGMYHVYGPFPDAERALRFAEFLSAGLDPAQPLPLRSPADELTAWYEMQRSQS